MDANARRGMKCRNVHTHMMRDTENNNQKKRLLGFKDVVEEFGMTMWFWRSRVWAKEIPAINMGRKIIIDRKDIEAFIQKNKQVA